MPEEILNTTPSSDEITDDDKLWAMLSWLPFVGWILAIVALVIEPQKNRPYIKHHAVQALTANVLLAVVSIIFAVTVILSCLAPFLTLILIYPAIKAYQGEELEITFITDFCKNQGWL